MTRRSRAGFTLVELIIVIAVIGILAAIISVAYPHWRKDTVETAMKNDLLSFASLMESDRNFNNKYSPTIPADFKTSNNNVLQLVGATDSYYCAVIQNTSSPDIILSYDSVTKDFRSYPCSGVPGGSTGGSMPNAPRGVNLAGDFTNWQLTGTAAVSNGILTLGANGTARTPPIRVSSPRTITVGGDLFANQQTPYTQSQPNAMFHINIYYYGADGVTAATNSSGQTGNGCAQSFAKGAWRDGLGPCTLTAGPNVIHARVVYYSTASGYASPDLQIRNPLLRVSD